MTETTFGQEVSDAQRETKGKRMKRFFSGRSPVTLTYIERALAPVFSNLVTGPPCEVKESRGRFRLRTAEETTRITVTIGKKTAEAIELIADEQGVTKSAAFNYVLSKGFVVEGLQARGAIIRAVMPNGEQISLKEVRNGEWVQLSAVPAPW